MLETILQTQIPPNIGQVSDALAGHWEILVGGIILIIIAIILFLRIKKIIINSVLGVIAWAILVFVLKIQLQLIPTLVISVIFGLAGIGVILVLKSLGVSI